MLKRASAIALAACLAACATDPNRAWFRMQPSETPPTPVAEPPAVAAPPSARARIIRKRRPLERHIAPPASPAVIDPEPASDIPAPPAQAEPESTPSAATPAAVPAIEPAPTVWQWVKRWFQNH